MEKDLLKTFFFLYEILGRRVVDSKGKLVGKIYDLKAVLGELFPKVVSLRIRKKSKGVFKKQKDVFEIDWDNIETINQSIIRLKEGFEKDKRPLKTEENHILLKDEILDKQVVDTFGAKVERVNDIHLLLSEGDLRLVHVDIGIRGILRRLKWVNWVDGITNWLFAYQIPDKFISWKYIQPAAPDPQRKELKLNVTLRKLNEIHPSDLADIIEELDGHERTAVFKSLDLQTAAETLEEIDPKLQVSLIEEASEAQASDILEEMAPDEAVDLLLSLPDEKKEKLFREMDKGEKEKLMELLKFGEGTAGSIMTIEYLSINQNQTVKDALDKFKKSTDPLETTSYIYLTDENNRLAGILTLRNLILNPGETKLSSIMKKDLIKLSLEDDIDTIADTFKKYKFMALPVVDKGDHLKGIITLRDAVDAKFTQFQD